MAKSKNKPGKEKQEPKLKVNATFDEVIGLSVSNITPNKKKVEKKPKSAKKK